jgi:hypothetical protein
MIFQPIHSKKLQKGLCSKLKQNQCCIHKRGRMLHQTRQQAIYPNILSNHRRQSIVTIQEKLNLT